MNWTALWVFIGVWVLTGLATGLWMARKGHDPRWTIIAVILGPLFVPIAFERIERNPRSIASEPVAMWGTASEESGGLRVMVGFDGSKHAEQALRTARKLFAPGGGVLELVAVVSYDDGADIDSEVLARAKERLEAAASGTEDVPVATPSSPARGAESALVRDRTACRRAGDRQTRSRSVQTDDGQRRGVSHRALSRAGPRRRSHTECTYRPESGCPGGLRVPAEDVDGSAQ